MPGELRNLIVLSDGTSNSASNPFKTNVWRLYQALDLTDGSQVAVFGDGVGNSSIKILRVLGLALGVGVKRNVMNLYKFLCHNHRPGDRIWMFGFSRGAFTVRVLAGLIESQGLVTFATEAELQQNAIAAYRAYRKDKFFTWIPWVWAGRHIRDGLIWCWRWLTEGVQNSKRRARAESIAHRRVRIHFIGVWDTVAAYGLPIDELTIAVDKWIWPMKFRDTKLLANVDNARHACGLDDERRTFHPIPWSENEEKKIQAEQKKLEKPLVPADRLLQVWFPGMHSDVGGGYPDDGLSLVPLCWMIEEAKAKKLKFEEKIVQIYEAQASPTGRLYDSRAGAGLLWRYQPRNVQFLMDENKDNLPEEDMVTPIMHHGAVTRITYGNDGYAPITLPLKFDILLPDGKRVAFDEAAVAKALTATQAELAKAAPAEPPALTRMNVVLTDLLALVKASSKLPRADYLALVLDTVWWRRVVYFITLGLALTAFAWPAVYEYLDLSNNIEKAKDILGDSVSNELAAIDSGRTIVGNVQTMANGLLTWVAGFVVGFLPSYAKPWIDAVTRNALAATSVVLLFLGSLGLSTYLQGRIYDRARAAWNVRQQVGGVTIESLKPTGQGFALLLLTIVFAFAAFFIFFQPQSNPPLFGVVAALGAIFFVLWLFRLAKPAEAMDPSQPKPILRIARLLRTNAYSLSIYRWVARTFVPLLFILAVAYLALSGLNLTIFNIHSTNGEFCKSSVPKKNLRNKDDIARAAQYENLEGSAEISLSKLCNPTGLELVAGRQYRIRIDTLEDWFDKSVPADVGGFASDGFRHAMSGTLKRWWTQKWFQPIARVGSIGNYEYPLKPAAPVNKTDFGPCKEEREASETPKGWMESVRDIPEPASVDTIAAEQICERKKGIVRAKVLFSDITPDATGELFIYVNDAILAWPGHQDLFYRNNTGTAKVTVTRVLAPEIVQPKSTPPK